MPSLRGSNACLQAADSPQLPLPVPPFHTWVLPDGSTWCQFFRTDDGYRLRFPSLADFTLSADGSRIVAIPVPGTNEATLQHLYLNQIVPLALSRLHALVLHAGAIAVAGEAVAFAGRSGQGKSTLVASFAADDYRFLTDDGLLIEVRDGHFFASPGHASIRLWEDSCQALRTDGTAMAPPISYSTKARLLAGQRLAHCDDSLPLRCVYLLLSGEGDEIRIEPCSGREAVMALVGNSFVLDVEERELLTQHFGELSALARQGLVFSLHYPRRYESLPAVKSAILRHVEGFRKASLPDRVNN